MDKSEDETEEALEDLSNYQLLMTERRRDNEGESLAFALSVKRWM